MKRITKTIMKTALIGALIFASVPAVKTNQKAEAANGSAVTAAGVSLEKSTADFHVMVEMLDQAIQNGTGQNVNFRVGTHFTIPADILRKMAGKNATLALHTGGNVTFSISGRDVHTANAPLTAEVSFDSVIPDEMKKLIPEGNIVKEFSMKEKQTYPCHVNVHLELGAEMAEKQAVLYSYEENLRALRQEGIFRINEHGQAMFGLERGDEYAVALYGGYTVMPGDTLSHIAVRNGISLQRLLVLNPQIKDAGRIQIGQPINLPYETKPAEE